MFRICVIIAGFVFVALALLNATRHIGAYLHTQNAKGPMEQRIRHAKWIWRA
ncbi:MAG: hypothetical protein VB144_11595 [Clostridia bacterium]|nr:hypothetical protein [Clostridia bacterium]